MPTAGENVETRSLIEGDTDDLARDDEDVELDVAKWFAEKNELNYEEN